MDAYPNQGKERILPARIEQYIAEKTGSAVVLGLDKVLDPGDSLIGGSRIAGFMETHKRFEWYLPLTAQKALIWKTYQVPKTDRDRVSFLISAGFGNGSPLPQPAGQWDIFCNDRFAVSVRVVNHSQLWRGSECTFAFSANRLEAAEPYQSLCLSSVLTQEAFATFGPALLTVPTSWLEPGQSAVIRVEAKAEAESTRWFHIATTSDILFRSDVYPAVDLLSRNGPQKVGKHNLYFGDIHTHSGQVMDEIENRGCGMGSWEDNYLYAKGPGGLDFYALTDHERQIPPDNPAKYFGLADKYNENGRFVCLAAYEFTNHCYGHRDIYFRNMDAIVVGTNRKGLDPTMDPAICTTPQELWSKLEAHGVPFITVPHHSSATAHPCSWDFYNPKYDRLIEVYSTWGSSEYYGDFPRGVSDRYRTLTVRDALNRGWRAGLIASSDGHDGHPGNAQSPLVKHHHQFHFLGSGRAAVFADELTREAVFDALYARRCYGTTGPPIVLSFILNEKPMGSEIPSLKRRKAPQVKILCEGTNGIDHIRIVKNGNVCHTVPAHGEFSGTVEWEDAEFDPDRSNYYYVRVVQVDRESAWSSPIWIG
ncbi:MAG TPA: CehA/McbA family metallohydrolase [bacterium]|nr:CehA/McbA family metallohydrolase [bacterium]